MVTMVSNGESPSSSSAISESGSSIMTSNNVVTKNGSNGEASATANGVNYRDMDVDQLLVDDDMEQRGDGSIRVGKDYQVTPPAFIPPNQRNPEETPERALLVWSPAPGAINSQIDDYIQVAKEKYGYNGEQALGMLFWHKHDLNKAIQDLSNFTPFPDEWTIEDKVLFEQAFQFHGKAFHRIRQMLPDKTIAQLVKYYYSWKKVRQLPSQIDRQTRRYQMQKEKKGSLDEDIQDDDSESDDDDKSDKDSKTKKPKCFNCGILCHVTHSTPKGQMCGTCHQYFVKTGNIRLTSAPLRKDGAKSKHSLYKNGNKPPKGMYVNHDDLVTLATGPASQGEALLKSMDREIISYKRIIQNNKQYLSTLQRRTLERRASIEPYRIPDDSKDESKINGKFSQDELLLGVQGIRTFGKNFKAIAEVLGNKTEAHVKSFYVTYKRRYNLDSALKEFQSNNSNSSLANNNDNDDDDDDIKVLDINTEELLNDK